MYKLFYTRGDNMDNKNYEEQLRNDIENVFQDIILEVGEVLDIPATARAGAQISDYLEDKFVEYFKNNQHHRIYNAKSTPKNQTKNPYDICWDYRYEDAETGETSDDLIWGDIKASKMSFDDSNPDLGTPTKMIKFMKDGHFHMLFIFFEYDSTDDNKVKLSKYPNGRYAKAILLKDISRTVRINPKPQFQVNIHEEPEYRTNSAWIDLFEKKYFQSLDRIIENAEKKKKSLRKDFDDIRNVHFKK